MVFLYKALAAGSCSVCLASAFVASPPAPPLAVAAVRGCSSRRDSSSFRRVRPRHSSGSRAEARLPPLLLSSRTVDVDVIDVTDVTEEEARREKEQQERNERIGRRYKGRPAAEVAKDVRELLDEALKIFRDAGPQVVGARGFRASRAVLLTLTDLVRDWRGGKLLRPKSEGGGGDAATAPSPAAAPPAAGPAAGAGRGVAAAAAAALSGQELDPAGAARALRLLFERLGATYIKLGQFIASSPTLFPPEYVLEFQKCLDATEPVPYSKILAIVKEEV
ncbi:unnamed protein product, partial [Ectocarpus sp. 6 AP-2014]